MVREVVAAKPRSSGSKVAQSKPNRRDTSRPCPVCGKDPNRDLDSNRHILEVHFPYRICCPHPNCGWRGTRQEMLIKHMKASTECGAIPESVHEYEIYSQELVLHWLLDNHVTFETVEMHVLRFIEERAIELKKVEAWGPPTEWRKSQSRRKQSSQIVVENDWVENVHVMTS